MTPPQAVREVLLAKTDRFKISQPTRISTNIMFINVPRRIIAKHGNFGKINIHHPRAGSARNYMSGSAAPVAAGPVVQESLARCPPLGENN